MIDRKYNRTADTGRFELIHRGIPVPVPIYVGIDLRVEGKPCRTGRPTNNIPTPTVGTQSNNNNTTTNNHTFVPALPQTNGSSPISSSSSNTPAESRPIVSHPP